LLYILYQLVELLRLLVVARFGLFKVVRVLTELLEVVAKLTVVNARLTAHIVTISSYELGLSYDLFVLALLKETLVCCPLFICLKGLQVSNLRVVSFVGKVVVKVELITLLLESVHD